MASERRVAVDTCVLVNVFTGGANDDPQWLEASLRVLRHGHSGDFRLVASSLTLPELAGTGNVRGNHLGAAERKRRIAKVRDWLDNHGPWLLVELDERLARAASELAIAHQLKGPDAVILGGALAAKAEALVTWDNDLLKLNGVLDIEILRPDDLYIEQEFFEDMGSAGEP